jgi:hypothetical protein
MRIYRPGNVEWDVNYTTSPPCPCWAWAITPEMGAGRVDRVGNTHHPLCPRPAEREQAADQE